MPMVYDAVTGETTFIEEAMIEQIAFTSDEVHQQYEKKVALLIREHYTEDEEFAILRKNMAGIDTAEFDAYNAYVEDVKLQVKTEFGI